MHGLPADAREDHIWIKKNGTRRQFSLHVLSKIPAIFEHHQIELVNFCALVFFWGFCFFDQRLSQPIRLSVTHIKFAFNFLAQTAPCCFYIWIMLKTILISNK